MPAEPAEEIHVTVVGRKQRPPKGVRVHHLAHLPDAELRRHEGLPLTSPSLTLLDLAGVLGPDGLLACLHEARVQQRVTDSELHATLVAHPNRRGAQALRKVLASEGGVRITRSDAERRTLRVLREHGLEPDASDWPVGPYKLDFYFAAEHVAVEYDGRTFHDNPKRFVSDRRRMAYLAARGIVTFPLTSYDIGAGAERAMADLRATLVRRRRAA
jgi:very-short-patch-repair endonuclease